MVRNVSVLFSFFLVFVIYSTGYSQERNTSQIDISRSINPSSLDGKTLQDLWLLRNEIYSKHGKPFKTYELHSYFIGKGYRPDRDYADNRLSPIERNNIELILARENELLKKNYVTDDKGKRTVNLKNILNQFQFGKFTNDQNQKLSANGFFVAPAKHEQIFHVYENNDYLGIPSFITTDTVLQVYSVFFDFTLRHIEEEILVKKLAALSHELLKHSMIAYKDSKEGMLKQAAKANLAYFTVPYYFLTGDKKTISKEVKGLVMEEIGLVDGHSNIAPPPILKSNKPDYEKPEMKSYWVDYSQFIPRGHYTRSETLKKYFMASLWFGLYPLHAEQGFEYELLQGLITTHLLYKKTYNGKPLLELWKDIYEPTAFYVGLSDDLGPDEFKSAMDVVYGDNPRISDFADTEKLNKVQKILLDRSKEKTRIRSVFNGVSQGPRFMLMGQRYIPDSEIMQRLVHLASLDPYMARAFPKGLDVMAAFGSKPAKNLMLSRYKSDWQKGFPDYPKELEKLIAEFAGLQEQAWKKNLYSSWIWSLKSLLELSSKYSYPFFMRGDAWSAKGLNTALASWSELRHHTILYAKQSFFGAECGGGGEEELGWVPDPPKGYVEPNVEFYKRLTSLLESSKRGLKRRNMLDKELGPLFERFTELVTFLERIAVKELKDEPRTIQEYEQIRRFGSLIENLTFNIYTSQTGEGVRSWSEIQGPDRRMPLIADVHTAYEFGAINVLEEGVGFANDIYVVVEIEGKLKLTRGAVFSYHEFKWPADDRLTDEKWQGMLDQGKQPPAPDWADMFMSKEPHADELPVYSPKEGDVPIPPPGSKPGWQLIYYDTGC